ncbi:hypothetical protein AA0242T_0932 [Acetobacter aceti NRIC 0242]|uniref:DUF4159 domain-containing protein n=1 Tax=Acetobacter aceti NBRC 14818 TaxID=887700 RepID=A0AB33I7B1_ACEAC|nr:DUF4159 domain-containing protein [Acetobacter aceti]TCS34998.1 putative membrane protein (TIGR02226 family) [Acetobacter aceti NBRC 14818]BCK74422.1 DUF4159 domain-containing protein [Acetobacter aceti NBRC 14818]GAN55931.1 hypothetical protein Abac_002_080 [Acetobacter aceti NBRC 14818]GBO80230.1 hypothetical protein AA0242T_0932 [Acetobacter aceti NRIC 0242]
MIFQFPALLAGLITLPAIWWLLRARPPSPRIQTFPPIALLASLHPKQDDAATPPFWLLLLRLAAAALLILGLSGPVIPGRPVPLPGNGTLLLVIDNDMMTAPDWNERNAAAHALLDAAGRAGRPAVLLTTASEERENPVTSHALPAEQVALALDALRPLPWAADRALAARQLEKMKSDGLSAGAVIYLSNGLASAGKDGGAADRSFSTAMQAFGNVQEVRFTGNGAFVLSHAAEEAQDTSPDSLSTAGVMAQLEALPADLPRRVRVRAHSEDGGTLALADVTLPAGASSAPVSVSLPTVMRNRVDMLTIDGNASAPGTLLLDEGDRLRPVGLIATGSGDTPLVGSLFYLRRALAPNADLHTGSTTTLLSQPLSVLIAPDGTLADAETQQKVADWVRKGGTLIRFAGRTLAGHEDSAQSTPETSRTETAAHADPEKTLLPVALMPTARQLGGAMSWGRPQSLADFPTDSPFHGLAVPKDVTVSRQILAQPATDLSAHSWARLADGTPLVTHATLGKGEIVLFHVTPTADWSNLPLSGLFVSMLTRLVEHASGVDIPSDNNVLPPVMTLDGEGVLGSPSPLARGLASSKFGTTPVSPEHPPGLYGSRAARRALNVGDTLHALSPLPPTGAVTNPAGHRPDRLMGPTLLAIALLLLAGDALATLFLRGFLSLSRARKVLHLSIFVGLSSMALSSSGFAQDAPVAPEAAPPAMASVPGAALETRLAYVVTGNPEVDAVSQEGLQGLSDYVNARTSAVIGHPDGVHPGKDDLAYYPLLYWPITSDAHADPAVTSALTTFIAHGGMIIIDTQGVDTANSGDNDTLAGEAPGSAAALRRVTAGLPIPPLMHLDDHHVLSHTFYLLHDFPGRYAGQPVWVARDGEAENDDVSPVIIGSADWAHAWAVDQNGDTRFAVLPGGDEQRRTAYRFGVNAVIYALTGNYKADQVHVPAILKRLGQ